MYFVFLQSIGKLSFMKSVPAKDVLDYFVSRVNDIYRGDLRNPLPPLQVSSFRM